MIGLVGNEKTIQELQDGVSAEQIVASWAEDLKIFDAMRKKYYLYK